MWLTNQNTLQWILLAVIIWVLPWKGVALWKAARASQRIWFIVLLVVNTLAILEILYIFVLSRLSRPSVWEKTWNKIKFWKRKP